MAYSARVHNFNKQAETAVESKAVQQYKDSGSGDEYKNDPTSALGSSK